MRGACSVRDWPLSWLSSASAVYTLLLSVPAQAMRIERVISSKGVEAWLVEEHGVPLITMRFAFNGGASQDLPGKEGVAHFVSGMLDEGADKLNSVDYHDKLEDLAARMRFDASRDVFSGTFQTLTKNQNEFVRASASGADFGAHGPGRGRAHPGPNPGGHQDRSGGPREGRRAGVVQAGFRQPSLRTADPGHRRSRWRG